MQTTILFLRRISCFVVVTVVCSVPALAAPQAGQDNPASQDTKAEPKKPDPSDKSASSPFQQATDKDPQPHKSLYSLIKKEPPRMPEIPQTVEILSDREGVDFGPYMKRLQTTVQDHWQPLVPKSAYLPERKSGLVTIKFMIMKDGSVRSMERVQSTGNTDLDRAAWGAITSSSPFPALPAAYTKDLLVLQCNFFYNPVADDKTSTELPKQPDAKK